MKLVMDREAWYSAVHGVAKSWTWLSDRTELTIDYCRNMWLSVTGLLHHSCAKYDNKRNELVAWAPVESNFQSHFIAILNLPFKNIFPDKFCNLSPLKSLWLLILKGQLFPLTLYHKNIMKLYLSWVFKIYFAWFHNYKYTHALF